MSGWFHQQQTYRVALIAFLSLCPVGLLILLGFLWLWERPQLQLPVYLAMIGCWAAAALLAWLWQSRQLLLPSPALPPSPLHTERDKQAWKLIEDRVSRAAELDPRSLTSLQAYVDTAAEMASEISSVYHPKATDPVGGLTIPEILAVIELSAAELWDLVDQKLPGSHLLTLDQWRAVPSWIRVYQNTMPFVWVARAVMDPIGTAIRWAASEIGIGQPMRKLQGNVVLWFYQAFIYRLGHYLIEVNSGRLRKGARFYRETVARLGTPRQSLAPIPETSAKAGETAPPTSSPQAVTITVLGQVKAGKSSLINALLGEQRAATAVLPLTREITRYHLHLPDASDELSLLDTVGYGHKGPREDQLAETLEAVKTSDLVLLVLNARDPARQPDLLLLQAIKKHFEEHVALRMPPIVGVMTFIDLLPPAMEWQPPYDWNRPARAKEQHVVEATRLLQETLGEYLCGIVPVCTLPGKVYGVQEHLVPMLVGLLDEARGVSVLRLMTQERNWDKLAKAYAQALSLAKEVWRVAVVGSSGERRE